MAKRKKISKAAAGRVVRLFKNGRNQAVRIPREWELPGKTALVTKDGARLILEPIERKDFIEALRFGAAEVGSPRLLRQIEGMLGSISVLPFEPPADQRYAELRTALQRAGTAIGPNDMLIAAHALALGCTIMTGDVAEFSRVRGLRVENWLQ